ncbi:hypothetical protein BEP19_01700 [Ammoniphilus oxalaticus]|uniref:Uncharacterized protein n=1 Tax=Ammoniphilus oxalaticus TaxID=66863 RepID=A0A419SN66_9BACL|nr:hypothetical protein [Ammoniphilus oxalaticus]RKD25682.1 hypothetical protein BEP19_01700 [Ammoniphilus oxalaticus]
MRRSKYPSYDEKFIKFSVSIERWLVVAIFILLLSLVLTQTLLRVDTFRSWIVEVEKLEGIAS